MSEMTESLTLAVPAVTGPSAPLIRGGGGRARTTLYTETLSRVIVETPSLPGSSITSSYTTKHLENYRTTNISGGRPWRYSVFPSTPDFPTEYQIRRNSNPAGLPVFAAIWGTDFRASTLTHMFR